MDYMSKVQLKAVSVARTKPYKIRRLRNNITDEDVKSNYTKDGAAAVKI